MGPAGKAYPIEARNSRAESGRQPAARRTEAAESRTLYFQFLVGYQDGPGARKFEGSVFVGSIRFDKPPARLAVGHSWPPRDSNIANCRTHVTLHAFTRQTAFTATASSVEYLLVTHLSASSGSVSREVVVLLDRLHAKSCPYEPLKRSP